MNANWQEATRIYKTVKKGQLLPLQNASTPVNKDAEIEGRIHEINYGAVKLDEFMNSYGDDAIELLLASNRRIIFGEDRTNNRLRIVYYIGGHGLIQSIDPLGVYDSYMGIWIQYDDDIKGTMSPITSVHAIEAAVNYGDKKANEVVDWLKVELDKIAMAVLENP